MLSGSQCATRIIAPKQAYACSLVCSIAAEQLHVCCLLLARSLDNTRGSRVSRAHHRREFTYGERVLKVGIIFVCHLARAFVMIRKPCGLSRSMIFPVSSFQTGVNTEAMMRTVGGDAECTRVVRCFVRCFACRATPFFPRTNIRRPRISAQWCRRQHRGECRHTHNNSSDN